MNRLELTGVGKRFHRHWIFRKVDFSMAGGDQVLLCGDNGAGKSTLMRIIAGQLTPTEGQVRLTIAGKEIDPELWYRHIAWSGPYIELYGDLSLGEAIALHARFRDMLVPQAQVAGILQLEQHGHKALKHFSSGMLHRVKVGLTILTRAPILLLDEATTNMDEANSRLVMDLMREHLGDRMLLFASNRQEEFGLFQKRLDLSEFVGKGK